MDPILRSIILSRPPRKKPEGLTAEQAVTYAEEHISYFERLLDQAHLSQQGGPSIRPGECRDYLAIWKKVLACAGDWDKLDNLAKNELVDAWCEDNE